MHLFKHRFETTLSRLKEFVKSLLLQLFLQLYKYLICNVLFLKDGLLAEKSSFHALDIIFLDCTG
jgi:phosphate starvation-inducible membrane PsiE